MKKLDETRHLWRDINQHEAISRAMYTVFDMYPDIMAIASGKQEHLRIGTNNISDKIQIVLNLLSPYGDKDDTSEGFRQDMSEMFKIGPTI